MQRCRGEEVKRCRGHVEVLRCTDTAEWDAAEVPQTRQRDVAAEVQSAEVVQRLSRGGGAKVKVVSCWC